MPLRAPGGISLSPRSNAPEHTRAHRSYRTHSHTMASSKGHSALGGQESIPQPPAEGFVSVFTNTQRIAYPSSQNANPHTDENILAISVDGLPLSTLTQSVMQRACRRVGQSSSGSKPRYLIGLLGWATKCAPKYSPLRNPSSNSEHRQSLQ
jgi:hypothetical protein